MLFLFVIVQNKATEIKAMEKEMKTRTEKMGKALLDKKGKNDEQHRKIQRQKGEIEKKTEISSKVSEIVLGKRIENNDAIP